MDEIKQFPISLGNVVYLNGLPDQSDMENLVAKMIEDADVEAALNAFSETLLKAGRPGKRSNLVVEYGPRITDWLSAGAFIKRVPWHRQHRLKGNRLPMFELHSNERSGWCAEACDGVLLHVRFDGNDEGLSANDMACLLSESPDPHPSLTAWLQRFLEEDRDFFIEDVSSIIPNTLKIHLGYHFQLNKRIASMWLGGDESKPMFRTFERDADIEREFF